ncbi:MAG: hypothetical protein CMM93_01730 [Rickettsiales bacterium]|nr:hypothetical protein [Rickettsiales bacterium]
MSNNCFRLNGILNSSVANYSYSTIPGPSDATVVGPQTDPFDFAFKPLVAGTGVTIDENPDSVVFNATSSNHSLQAAYDGGNTIVTNNTDDINISGNARFELDNPQGLFIQNYNVYADSASNIGNGQTVEVWPPPTLVFPPTSIAYLRTIFIANDLNVNESFVIKSEVKFDPTNANPIKETKLLITDTPVEITATLSGNTVHYILTGPSVYNIDWTMESLVKDR